MSALVCPCPGSSDEISCASSSQASILDLRTEAVPEGVELRVEYFFFEVEVGEVEVFFNARLRLFHFSLDTPLLLPLPLRTIIVVPRARMARLAPGSRAQDAGHHARARERKRKMRERFDNLGEQQTCETIERRRSLDQDRNRKRLFSSLSLLAPLLSSLRFSLARLSTPSKCEASPSCAASEDAGCPMTGAEGADCAQTHPPPRRRRRRRRPPPRPFRQTRSSRPRSPPAGSPSPGTSSRRG
mgnify:FL=1